MNIPWSLVIEIVVILIVLSIIWKFVRGLFKIALLIGVVIVGILAYQYVTSPDFSADKIVKDFGRTVQSVAEMSPAFIDAAGDTIKVIQETGSGLSLNEKGVKFKGKDNGLEGTLGLNSKGIVLHMTAPVSDDSAINTMVNIASVFSGDSTVGETIDRMRNGTQDHRVSWGSGYIEIKNGVLVLVREK